MMSRQPRLAWKAILSFVLMSFPASARASVKDIPLKELFARSDLVVVARVFKVEQGPADLQPAGDEFPAVKVATARVMETWKGRSEREIRFIASPTQICDIASAEEGERVVLFLEGSKDSPYTIAHLGRGRMPIHDAEDKRYATPSNQVILPEGTPTIPMTKTDRIVLPSREPGQPVLAFDYKYTERAIELWRLRKLVKGDSRPDRPASP